MALPRVAEPTVGSAHRQASSSSRRYPRPRTCLTAVVTGWSACSTVISADDLRPWSDDVAVEGLLAGGVRSEAIRVRIDGIATVARRSRRRPDSLDWELDLLEHLAHHGVWVPEPLPTANGARQIGGLTVSSWLDGVEPSSSDDWHLVVAELGGFTASHSAGRSGRDPCRHVSCSRLTPEVTSIW